MRVCVHTWAASQPHLRYDVISHTQILTSSTAFRCVGVKLAPRSTFRRPSLRKYSSSMIAPVLRAALAAVTNSASLRKSMRVLLLLAIPFPFAPLRLTESSVRPPYLAASTLFTFARTPPSCDTMLWTLGICRCVARVRLSGIIGRCEGRCEPQQGDEQRERHTQTTWMHL